MTRYAFAILLTAVSTIISAAEPIEPCSLLSAADLAELGVPAGAMRSTEKQQGGVLYCKYQVPGTSTSVSYASVIVSTAVPDRALQVRAMLNKALSEDSPAQLEARGEYFAPNATCKVVLVSQVETSQCLGATEQSVVGLTLVRTNRENKVSYPALQLRFISKLVSSVGERGG
jgi:hypothetical protein